LQFSLQAASPETFGYAIVSHITQHTATKSYVKAKLDNAEKDAEEVFGEGKRDTKDVPTETQV
jgi:hypothetical protein